MPRIVRDPRYWFVAALLVCLAVAELALHARLISPAIYARPSEIATRLVEMVVSEGLLRHLWGTTALSMLGAAIGFPGGCLLSCAINLLGRAEPLASYLLDFVRSIPVTTLVPIFLAIYGIGAEARVAIASVSAGLAAAITVHIGIRSAESSRREIVHLLQPPAVKKLFEILLVEALPSVVAGLRLAISTALILVVVAEMFIGTEFGAGKIILDKTYTDDRAGQYAAVLALGTVGFLLNLLPGTVARLWVRAPEDTEKRADGWL